MSVLLASMRNALPFLRRIRRKDDWAIGLYSGGSLTTLAPMPGVPNPVLTAAHVRDVPALFVADPFLVRTADRWLLFFEVLHANLRRGQIGLATSHNGKDWEYCQIVLREPFHLSYPLVFTWDEAFYMIPETAERRQVRLYRAVEFPLRWSYVATLLEGDDYLDPTPFAYQGRWWMFVGTDLKGNGTLRLYHAATPYGPWNEHPCSPIVRDDPRSARPAGRVMHDGERLVRFAQDCSQYYGQRVLAFEITALTPERYAERPYSPAPTLVPQRAGWNARGMHTLDLHRMENGCWLALVDGYRKRFYVRHSMTVQENGQ